jgi:hypothetical protein
MNVTRESIYAAVFAKFSALSWTPGIANTPGAFVQVSRRLRHWSDVPVEQMPALFQVQTKEMTKQQRGLPTQWTLGIELYLYVGTNTQMDDTVTPSLLLNPILDAVDNALRPDNQALGTCTLGGLVSHAWIAGAIETSEGNLGSIEAAIVPIEMLVPN